MATQFVKTKVCKLIGARVILKPNEFQLYLYLLTFYLYTNLNQLRWREKTLLNLKIFVPSLLSGRET